ncbi:MAG: hypothetical protein JST82_07045 [Bacteroidetes bacterium]|nr:hypothetical protein [Bacteroidota bacterium]
MMQRRNHIVLFTLLVAILNITVSCKQTKSEEFIEKYKDTDFSKFKNRYVYYRGTDLLGNYIIIAGGFDDTAKCSAPIFFKIDEHYKVLSVDKKFVPADCPVDEVMLKDLAVTFAKYKIFYLGVDDNGNVFISIRNSENQNIARFASKDIPASYKTWVPVKDNWYKER